MSSPVYGKEFLRSQLVYGVGGLDDLLVRLRQEPWSPVWYAEVHRGTLFEGEKRLYQYVEPQTATISLPSLSQPTPILVIPSGAAAFPVQVSGSSGGIYRYLPCGFTLLEMLPSSPSGIYWVGTVSGFVTDVYLDGNPLIRSNAPPVQDYEYFVSGTTVLLTRQGACRVSYLNLVPSLWQYCSVYSTGGLHVELLAPPVDRYVQVNSPTGLAARGVSATGTVVRLDRALEPGYYAAQYLVDRTFCLTPTTYGVALWVYSSAADTLQVTWEGEPYRDWILLGSENLHPLSTNRRYFFIARLGSPLPSGVLSQVECLVSPPFLYRGLESSTTQTQLIVTAYDVNGDPISGAQVEVSTGSPYLIYRIENGISSLGHTSVTDTNGNAFFLIRPIAPIPGHSLQWTITVRAGGQQRTKVAWAWLLPMVGSVQAPSLDGSTPVVLRDLITPQPDSRGRYRWWLSVSFVDGTPIPLTALVGLDIEAASLEYEVDLPFGADGVAGVWLKPESTGRVRAVVRYHAAGSVLQTNPVIREFEGGTWR